jgi:hypothetical protein
MPEVGVPEAALVIGVSPVRVRQLIASGQLRAREVGGRWLVDVESLPSAPRRGRPMSQRIAWALLLLADGQRADWASAGEISRLRAQRNRLAHDPEPELLLRSWLASRANRHVFSAPEPQGLREDPRLVLSGISDPRSGMSAGAEVEGYVHPDDLQAVCADHLLVPSSGERANVVLHASPAPLTAPVPVLLLAADLAEHDGPRELERSRDLIRQALESWPQGRSRSTDKPALGGVTRAIDLAVTALAGRDDSAAAAVFVGQKVLREARGDSFDGRTTDER